MSDRTICKVCRKKLTNDDSTVFRRGWWYCFEHDPERRRDLVYLNPDTGRVSLPVDDNGEADPLMINALIHGLIALSDLHPIADDDPINQPPSRIYEPDWLT